MKANNNQSFIDEIKKELEDLEAQLKKSGAEFQENYNQKKQKIAAKLKEYAAEIEGFGGGKVSGFKDSSMELLDLLEADYDLSYTDYESKSHKISSALDDFEEKVKEIFENLTSDTKEAKAKLEIEINKNLNKFRTELDIQKAHFKATKERGGQEFEEWKEKRLKEIADLKIELEHKKAEAEDKFEKFSGEISSSVEHLKKAFKNLW